LLLCDEKGRRHDKQSEEMHDLLVVCNQYIFYLWQGKAMQLPLCIVKAVRDAYPEPSGIYEGFSFEDFD
jgi:hypothetical protein